MPLNFIDSNPALDQFEKQQKADTAERLANAHSGLYEQQATDLTTMRPGRLRRTEAEASTAETNAGVQAKTAMPLAEAHVRSAQAAALNAKMAGFYKSLDLLNAGDIEAAQEVARQTGQTLPGEMINNADARAAVTAAAKQAKEYYPGRPADQNAFIKGQITDMGNRTAQGQRASTPTAPYTIPEGAPEPQDTATRDQYRHVGNTPEGIPIYLNQSTGEEILGGQSMVPKSGAGGRQSVFQQKQAAWLAVHEGDTQGALEYASGRREMSGPEVAKSAFSQAAREINGNMQLHFKNQAERTNAINQRAEQIATQIRSGFGQAAPAPAPRPAAQRPDMMSPGDGGKPANVQMPPAPAGVPPGSSYSPSRQMWRTPDGRLLDASGQPVGP